LEEVLSKAVQVRILFISQLFDPENAIKGASFARSLQDIGHEVEVITTFPSYPGGRIFAGYRQQWRQVEDMNGVRVVRVPTYVSHGQSAMKRMASYVSFALSAGFYAMFSARKQDVIYAYYPPVLVGLLGLTLGWFKRVPYVYDVQDLWPEALVATGNVRADSRLTKVIEHLCRWVYRRAARVVVLSDGYRDALIRKGVPGSKVVRVFNWCDENRMQAANCMPTGWADVPGRFRVLYAGNLGAAQGLAHVVDAASKLHQSGITDIQVVFLGGGVERDALVLRAKDLPNVTFLPAVKVDEVGNYLAAADVLLVHLADDPVFDITIPQKTQAYLLAGKPILMAVRGEAASLVSSAGAGLVVPPENAELMADAMLHLSKLTEAELLKQGSNGRKFYQEKMSAAHGIGAIEEMLREAVEKR
jgi:colanic acid biosynthesis glycosyl transferase WcaI